jgi:hypothetical protein
MSKKEQEQLWKVYLTKGKEKIEIHKLLEHLRVDLKAEKNQRD